MIIEFCNCELEIQYIGTKEEILIQKFNEALNKLSNAFFDLTKNIVKAMNIAIKKLLISSNRVYSKALTARRTAPPLGNNCKFVFSSPFLRCFKN